MEGPPIREGTFSLEARYYIEKLERKEEECNEISSSFNKYKLKTKVRFDQLRHEIYSHLNTDPSTVNENENAALLVLRLAETQFRLEESEKHVESLEDELQRQQLHINDQIILIRNLEEQLHAFDKEVVDQAEVGHSEQVDMDKIHSQMMYKDERIVELNNVILDKERQILDLLESCREQGEVATAKKEAMRIVQKKFEEMERRGRREATTETDSAVTGVTFGHHNATAQPSRALKGAQRNSSPGRAVPSKSGCSSPPPLDPSEELGRASSAEDPSFEIPSTSHFSRAKVDGVKKEKPRKKVTFHLPPTGSREDITRMTEDADNEEVVGALIAMVDENERLRTEVNEVHARSDQLTGHIIHLESCVKDAEREGRTASLKARAVAQARIRELEERMAALNTSLGAQTERLQTQIDTLRTTRDWEVERNAQLREQLSHSKEKCRQLREELDTSVRVNRAGEKKLKEKEDLIADLVAELEEAEGLAVFLEDQKHAILDDVDKLKEALIAHGEYIELLEADMVIYETRVGNLRESLGVTKINQRDHIKSKAFNTKLRLMAEEKEQVARTANDERLRTKALHAKVQLLETENEKLVARLCELEMNQKEESEVDMACHSLQLHLDKTEAELASVRKELEVAQQQAALLHSERNERRQESCDGLGQNEGRQSGYHFPSDGVEDPSISQTFLPASSQQEDSIVSLQERLEESERERERLVGEREELMERISILGGENFEVNRQIKELETTARNWQHQFNRLSEEIYNESEERKQQALTSHEREEELIALQARVREQESNIVRIQDELERSREELDHARLGMTEAAAVKKEVERLREQLETERLSGEEKWNEVVERLRLCDEQHSELPSRKTSIEDSDWRRVEAQLRRQLETAEEDRVRLALELEGERREREEAGLVKQASDEASGEEEDQNAETIIGLKKKIEELSMEARLSEELNIELGWALREMEEKLEEAEVNKGLNEIVKDEHKAQVEELKDEANRRETGRSQSVPAELAAVVDEAVAEEIEMLRVEVAELTSRLKQANSSSQATENELREEVLSLSRELALSRVRGEHLELQLEQEQKRLLDLQFQQLNSEARSAVSESGHCLQEEEYLHHSHDTTDAASLLQTSPEETSKEAERSDKVERESEEDQKKEETVLVEENLLLRLAVEEATSMQENVGQDISRLIELKEELEIAVEALRGEIWTLNGQLKASILDRENLQDRVVDLDTRLTSEKRRADLLDSDLAEQTELTEKAQRQAAEAENESNRRLAECLDMESRREELERAYAQLTEYYTQLQAAYSTLYARLQVEKSDAATETEKEKEEKEEKNEGDCPVSSSSSSSGRTHLRNAYSQNLALMRHELAALKELSALLHEKVTATEQLSLGSEIEESELASCSTDAPSSANVPGDDLTLESNLESSSKMSSLHSLLKSKMKEVEIVHEALREQRRICRALEERLGRLEEGAGPALSQGEAVRGELEERIEECTALKNHVQELETMLAEYAQKEAAKLAARQADVDSLFRTNAELAHTNVHLQNELDEAQERLAREDASPGGNPSADVSLFQNRITELLQKVEELEGETERHLELQKEMELTILRLREGNEEEKKVHFQTKDRELASVNEELRSLRVTLDDKDREIAQASSRIDELEDDVERLEKIVQSTQMKKEEAERQKREEASCGENDKERMRQRVADLECEIEEMKTEENGMIVALKCRLESLATELEGERARRINAEKIHEQPPSAVEESLKESCQKLKNNTEEDEWGNDWGEATPEAVEVSGKVAELEQKILQLEDKMDEIIKKFFLHTEEQKRAQLEHELSDLKEELSAVKAEKMNLESKLEAAKSDTSALRLVVEEGREKNEMEMQQLEEQLRMAREERESRDQSISLLSAQLLLLQREETSEPVKSEGWDDWGEEDREEAPDTKERSSSPKRVSLPGEDEAESRADAEIMELKDEIERLQQEREEYQLMIGTLESEMSSERKKRSSIEESYEQLKFSTGQISVEIEKILAEKEKLLDEFQRQREKHNIELEALKAELAGKGETEEDWGNGWGEETTKEVDSSEELQALFEENTRLKQENEELGRRKEEEMTLRAAEEAEKKWKAEEEMEELLKECSRLRVQNELFKECEMKLTESLDDYMERLEKAEQELRRKDEDIEMKTKLIDQLRQEIVDKDSQLTAVRLDADSTRAKLQESEHKLGLTLQELSSLKRLTDLRSQRTGSPLLRPRAPQASPASSLTRPESASSTATATDDIPEEPMVAGGTERSLAAPSAFTYVEQSAFPAVRRRIGK